MKFRILVNRLLAPLNLAITKRSTLNQLPRLEALHQFKHEIFRYQHSLSWQVIDYIIAHQEPSTKLVCSLCGYKTYRWNFKSYETQCIFGGGQLLRYQCPECDVIFGDQKMFNLTEKQLEQEYKRHYELYSEGDSTEAEKKAFFALQPQKEKVYCNFGAGDWSRSVSELRQEGWNVYAYEPHAPVSMRTNVDYMITDYRQLTSMRFDGIYSNNVLEHLRNPVSTLSSLAFLLKQDGKMAHVTPRFEYLYEYTRFHLFFFLGRSKKLLAKKSKLFIENYIKDDEFMCLVLSKDHICRKGRTDIACD